MITTDACTYMCTYLHLTHIHSFICSLVNIKRVLTSDGQSEEGRGVFSDYGGITAEERNPAQEVIYEVESRDGRQIPSQFGHEQQFPTLSGRK